METAGGPVVTLSAAWVAALGLAVAATPPVALFVVLGFVGAIFSGLLGIGVVITVPLLLYVPPLVGREPLTMHTVTGATMLLVAVVGIVGSLSHVRDRRVKWSLVSALGVPMGGAALVGAVSSKFVGSHVLLALFASLALAASAVLIVRRGDLPPDLPAGQIQVNRVIAFGLGGALGFLVGMVGLGGSFLLVPLMIHVLKVPLRVAMGSSLGILALTGIAGFLGKAVTAQVDWLLAAALIAGSMPGVRIGVAAGRRIDPKHLSLALGLVLALISARMWWDVLK